MATIHRFPAAPDRQVLRELEALGQAHGLSATQQQKLKSRFLANLKPDHNWPAVKAARDVLRAATQNQAPTAPGVA